MTKWATWFGVCITSILTGTVLAVASQAGERWSTSMVEQVRSGDPPIVTFIGMGLVILPGLVTLVLIRNIK